MEFRCEPNRIFLEDIQGKLLAEVTFPQSRPNTAEINHTFVDPSLRGQGVAGKLMAAAAKHLRSMGYKVNPTCSYAVKWFSSHPEEQDLLVDKSVLLSE